MHLYMKKHATYLLKMCNTISYRVAIKLTLENVLRQWLFFMKYAPHYCGRLINRNIINQNNILIYLVSALCEGTLSNCFSKNFVHFPCLVLVTALFDNGGKMAAAFGALTRQLPAFYQHFKVSVWDGTPCHSRHLASHCLCRCYNF